MTRVSQTHFNEPAKVYRFAKRPDLPRHGIPKNQKSLMISIGKSENSE